MVFYRKYRPQTISELDSPKLQETLRAVLSQKEIPHAFLFTGPKGLGKTSTARIIAKVLNCTGSDRNGIEPCDKCEQCISIKNGTNIDVLEIDGASNRGIDEIRELRERVNLAPSAAKKKVYIIDEVHMLTTEAFNALLKTIEEPPSHVVFIFATTEPQKVPATIISRCFHISLNRATKDELIHSLKRITEKEKIDIDDEALSLIAEMGDGGYRDATKIFEEVVAIANGKKITREFLDTLFNKSTIQLSVLTLFGSLKKEDKKESVKESLQTITDMVNQGVEIKYFVSECLNALHEGLLVKEGVLEDSRYGLLAKELDLNDFQTLVQLFSEAYQQTKFAVIPSLPLELAVVQFCQQSASVISSSENEKSSRDLSAMPRDDNRTSGMTISKTGMTMQDAFKKEQNIKVKQILTGTKPVAPEKPKIEHTQENLPRDIKDHAVLLENLIYKVKPINVSVAGVLRSCVVQSVTDDRIVFETAYAFHKERLEDPKSKEILEKGLKEITGKTMKVSIVLKGK